jgi:hypothetical protein
MVRVASNLVNLRLRFFRRHSVPFNGKLADFVLGKLFPDTCQKLDTVWVRG